MTRKNLGRYLRWAFFIGVSLVALGWGIVNSPLVKGRVEKMILQRIGVKANLGTVVINPFESKIIVGETTCRYRDSKNQFLSIEKMEIALNFRSLFKEEKRPFKSISIEAPFLDLSEKQLQELLETLIDQPSFTQVTDHQTLPLIKEQLRAPQKNKLDLSVPKQKGEPVQKQKPLVKKGGENKSPLSPKALHEQKGKQAPLVQAHRKIKINKGKIKIGLTKVSSDLPVIEIDEIALHLSTDQEERSFIEYERLLIGEQELRAPKRLPLVWKQNQISAKGKEVKGSALRYQYDFSLMSRPPYLVKGGVSLTHSEPHHYLLFEWSGFGVDLDQAQLTLQGAGSLLQLTQMKLYADARVGPFTLRHQKRGGNYHFEYAQLKALMRNGLIQVPLVKVYQPELVLMGNGYESLFQRRGRGVVRIVANDRWSEVFTRFGMGSLLTRWTSRWLYPLEGNRDRYFRDFHFKSEGAQVWMNSGRPDQWENLESVVSKIKAFAIREMSEEN